MTIYDGTGTEPLRSIGRRVMSHRHHGRMATISHDGSSMFPTPGALTNDQRVHLHRRLLDEWRNIARRLARYGENGDEVGPSNRVPLHEGDDDDPAPPAKSDPIGFQVIEGALFDIRADGGGEAESRSSPWCAHRHDSEAGP
jgi:hypothetical protein